MKILGVPGSLRRESYNRMLLQAAAELLPDGVELELFEELKALPPYDEDDEWGPVPASVARLREALAGADAVLFATPEYNHSIPGQLKNALDWISRPPGTSPLRNKPVAVVGASQGAFGAVWAQADLRRVLAAIGARVLDAELPVAHAHTRFDPDGTLTDETVREQLGEIVGSLVAEARPPVAAAAAAAAA